MRVSAGEQPAAILVTPLLLHIYKLVVFEVTAGHSINVILFDYWTVMCPVL